MRSLAVRDGISLTERLQVRKVAEENGVDVSESIRELEERAKQVTCCFDVATC